jgi:hypothetical protein
VTENPPFPVAGSREDRENLVEPKMFYNINLFSVTLEGWHQTARSPGYVLFPAHDLTT